MRTLSALLVLTAASAAGAVAQIPRTLSYQGILADSSGNPKPDGVYTFTFRLYETPAGGSPLWTEVRDVNIRRGLFATILGDVTPFGATVKFDRQYWLGIKVGAEAEFPERTLLAASGYALGSLRADSAGFATVVPDQSITTARLSDNAVTSAKILDGTISSVDIGNGAVTLAKLGQAGAATGQVIKWSGNGWSAGDDALGGLTIPYADSVGVAGGAVFRVKNRNQNTANYGIWGESNGTTGTGVYGLAAAQSGVNMGVRGHSNSATGYGVYGTCSNFVGVLGYADGTVGTNYGVYGQSDGDAGYGVYGRSSASKGVYGSSTDDTGVYGIASSVSGSTYGVYGRTNSTAGHGVYGFSNASSGVNYGVYGRNNSSSGFGVYGHNTSTGYAGFFLGDVHVSGTITKFAGSFKIDHPLDPANKYLSHSFVESPDMKNIYDGIITLDHNGEATVLLPEWFDALNKDVRYQLTPVGGPMPSLHVSQKISLNTFRIGGGTPGLDVSWQVTGIRKDAYAEKHRIPVEEEKRPGERGRYLSPDLFGFGREFSVPANLPQEEEPSR